MTTLLNLTLGAAQAAVAGPVFQYKDRDPFAARTLLLQGKLVTPAGGTTIDGWVQSTLDGGVTWFDIANFHFTTTAAVGLYNLSSLTVVSTQYAPTNGTLTANTAKDGLIGDKLRVLWTSTGTYTGGSFIIDAVPGRLASLTQSP